jgi:hypothetical protein
MAGNQAWPTQARAEAFLQLRPLCANLLQHRQDPTALYKALQSLHEALVSVDSCGLTSCYDYTMFPLIIMLESVVAARSDASAGGGGGGGVKDGNGAPPSSSTTPAVAVPAASSTRVAEALLQCLVTLVTRVVTCEADQQLTLVQRLAHLVQLQPSGQSEEVRTLRAI